MNGAIEPPPAVERPRFDAQSIERMKLQLLAEPKIKDLYFDETNAVEWTVGVYDDGTSRFGYAGYVCLVLSQAGLVDKRTDVRVVDFVKASRSGDWRAASLGHADCTTGDDLGV